jgi:predicted phosphodiesterase
MTERPERGSVAHAEWMASLLRRCSDDLDVPLHRMHRDVFRAWAKSLTEDERPQRGDVECLSSDGKGGWKALVSKARGSVAKAGGSASDGTPEVQTVAICSDIHFDCHDVPAWTAFRRWHTDIRPHRTVILGDFVDLGMMSRYPQGKNDPTQAIEQIRVFVAEANALAEECGELIVVEGNHDLRWDRIVLGASPHIFKGALGLSLKDQCYAQGLSASVRWVREDTKVLGVQCGPFILRHGHNQSGRYGGAKHLAANRLARTMGQSEVVGHHHRGQLVAQTAQGRTAIAIANPCLVDWESYAPDADWQRGFSVLEVFGDCATPYVIIMDDGRFAWRGKLYQGDARSPRPRAVL